MDKSERLLAALEIQSDLADYWHDVDTNWGANASSYYTLDGVFEAGRLRLEGRDAIQGFYSWREDRGARVAAHAVTNFRAEFSPDGVVTANWYMLLYAADGEPVLPTHSPVRICRMTDRYVHDAGSHRWLCRHRLFETLFEGGALLSVPDLTLPGQKAP